MVGENGNGKSTLLTAIALAAGMSAEGGSSNFAFPREGAAAEPYALSQRALQMGLGEALQLVRGSRRPKTDFFLRAESLFIAATYLEALGHDSLRSYGGKSLHQQSHGEGFLALMINRFGPDGFYLLDEPEAALSTQNCLTCLRRIHELVTTGSQFVICTRSRSSCLPDERSISAPTAAWSRAAYEDVEAVRLTTSFLAARRRFLHELFEG